ncbi:cytochrome c [uncultured Cohaesibacter sp.]|uniref:c-type cytochrome n=1 Tax=uncultured Cohaesibacter sp. TaxID=1002546 RepID=UPI002A0A7C3E|nr:cytochrome c [uncultured Cohaesibacter sp.]
MHKIALVTIALSLIAAPALAGPKEDAVAERQAFFKQLGGNMGPLAKLLKGDYDAATAQQHADAIANLTTKDISGLFVEGTSTADMPGKTEALPVIWEDMDGFAAKYKALGEAAANLKAEAGKGKAQLAAAFGQTGAACKSCHTSFRD